MLYIRVLFFTFLYSVIFYCQNIDIVRPYISKINLFGNQNKVLGLIDCFEGNNFKYSFFNIWELYKENNNFNNYISRVTDPLFFNVSQNSELLVVTTYPSSASENQSIIFCHNLKNMKDQWNHTLDDVFGYAFIRNMSFIENTNIIVVLFEKEIIYLDSETGNILYKKDSIMDDYSNAGEVLELRTNFSKSGRYFVIWNRFVGGGLLPQFLYPHGNEYVTVWDVVEDSEVIKIKREEKEFYRISFTSNEKELIIRNVQNEIIIWSIVENREIKRYEYSKDKIIEYVIGDYIVIKEKNNWFMKRYDEDEQEKGIEIKINEKYLRSVDITEDGKYFAYSNNYNIFLYKTENWELLWKTNYNPEQEEIK